LQQSMQNGMAKFGSWTTASLSLESVYTMPLLPPHSYPLFSSEMAHESFFMPFSTLRHKFWPQLWSQTTFSVGPSELTRVGIIFYHILHTRDHLFHRIWERGWNWEDCVEIAPPWKALTKFQLCCTNLKQPALVFYYTVQRMNKDLPHKLLWKRGLKIPRFFSRKAVCYTNIIHKISVTYTINSTNGVTLHLVWQKLR
jgi:hypothetical protein